MPGSVNGIPAVRFLRWDGKPVPQGPLLTALGKAHTFIVSLAEASGATHVAGVCVKIATGAPTRIRMSRVGGNAGSGHLWQGTIAAGSLDPSSEYLLRVTAGAHDAACEIELKTTAR
jgi:hypothetical protein